MRELALFAGGGGGILGGYLMGWKTVCAVEIDNYARNILLARQRDGILPAFPIWDDIKTFDGRPWAGRCDIITGGFPCQDISLAGKGKGITGPKSKLWKPMSRVVREVEPEFVLVENSPALTLRGFGTVLGDLVKMAHTNKIRRKKRSVKKSITDPPGGKLTPQTYPTPQAKDYRTGQKKRLSRKQKNLNDYCAIENQKRYPTPTYSDYKRRGPNSKQQSLSNIMPVKCGLLNPSWVEWLMGFPVGWTDLKPLEMHRFRRWQRLHSLFSVKV